MDQFIADHLFQIFSKVYLQTLKKPVQFFASHLLQILKKLCLQILKKDLAQYFAHQLFQILKKVDLQIFKKPGPIFCLSNFSNIKRKHIYKSLKNLV